MFNHIFAKDNFCFQSFCCRRRHRRRCVRAFFGLFIFFLLKLKEISQISFVLCTLFQFVQFISDFRCCLYLFFRERFILCIFTFFIYIEYFFHSSCHLSLENICVKAITHQLSISQLWNSFQLAVFFHGFGSFEVDIRQTADGHLKINQSTDIFGNAIKMSSIQKNQKKN